jgi:hypothetical protein
MFDTKKRSSGQVEEMAGVKSGLYRPIDEIDDIENVSRTKDFITLCNSLDLK